MSRRYLVQSELPFTAPQYGLLSVATPLDLPGVHWQGGMKYEPLCPNADTTYDPCTSGLEDLDDPAEKEPTTEWAVRVSAPFTVRAQIDCSPVGVWDEMPSRVAQALTRAEGRSLEHAFLTGHTTANEEDKTVFPHLAYDGSDEEEGDALLQPAADVISDTPLDIVDAIGAIEEQMGYCYAGTPTLHIPKRLGAALHANQLAQNRSGMKTTESAGSKIALGSGYTGISPDGELEPGVRWIYATGEVFYHRSDVRVFDPVESFDRGVNTLHLMQERTYVIGWDCCLLAVPVIAGTEDS